MQIHFPGCVGLSLLACATLLASPQTPASTARSLHLANGRWFDGRAFAARDVYVSGGMFTDARPAAIDETIDLGGGYVIPPLADAHTHNFDTAFGADALIQRYLTAGIFYAKVQTDPRSLAVRIADKINRPDSVDVSYAHGAITSSYGHGVEIYEGLLLFRRPGGFTRDEVERVRNSRQREGDAYYIADSVDELRAKWPRILAGKPDFIKIYLQESEHYEALRARTDTVGDRGVDPALVPEIVERAHAAGLRVSAHVATVSDYRTALAAGVDEMAHMPDLLAGAPDTSRAELTDADARETARRGVWVIAAPMAWAAETSIDLAARRRTDGVRARNLTRLKNAGVRLALGSDRYGQLVVDDARYVNDLGVFTRLELLKIWSEDTPRTIFPARRLGKLSSGYEASFLVLDANPLDSWSAVERIRLRFKQGTQLGVRPGV